jgi:hypothetical protein
MGIAHDLLRVARYISLLVACIQIYENIEDQLYLKTLHSL